MVRFYPRYGASMSHLPGYPAAMRVRTNNTSGGGGRDETESSSGGGGGRLQQQQHRLSWPQPSANNDGGDQPARGQRSAPVTNNNNNEATDNDRGSSGGGEKPRLRRVLCADDAKVFERATQIVMKNKSFRPRERGKKGLKNLQSVKTLAGRTQSHGKARKQPLTVTAQFQQSLHSLVDTLSQANPFFIRCIKSNGDKIPNTFDEETVQRQLRYTGMLETVRIRQAGYNVRLSYEEFVQLYRILLPRGLTSSQSDVRSFLATLNLNRDNYQLGASKVFLRECEKLKLDYRLHQQIMASIVAVQRWFRALLERRRFLAYREAALTIQSYWRMVVVQRTFSHRRQCEAAACQIQRAWRRYLNTSWYVRLRAAVVSFQAHARGFLARRLFHERHNKWRQAKTAETKSQSSLSKESSTEDIGLNDSESSGAGPEDSESDVGLPEPLARRMVAGKALDREREETREIRLGDPNKEIFRTETKKKLSSTRRTMRVEMRTCVDDSLLDKVERKGSCDSLTSQRSNDSQSSTAAPVRDTLHRAKRQIRALMGVVKKSESSGGGGGGGAHSDSEMDSSPHQLDSVWSSRSSGGGGAKREEEPTAPARIPRRRGDERPAQTQLDGKRNRANSSAQCPLSLELKRRNSDPAAGGGGEVCAHPLPSPLPEPTAQQQPQPPIPTSPHSPSHDLLQWKGTTMFTIAGHRFSRVARFRHDDRCLYCAEPIDAFVTQGHKCSDCKQLFHTKCIQNGGVLQLPCRGHGGGGGSGGSSGGGVGVGGRRKQRKYSRSVVVTAQTSPTARSPHPVHHPLGPAKFSLTGTSEFTDRTDKIISDVTELQLMQDFITKKIYKMESEEGKKPSQVDRVFRQALREFKDNLVATYSVVNKQGPEALNIKYKDLIANFLHVMETVCRQEQTRADFPVTMGVNAFRGFMNEFMALTAAAESERQRPKGAKRNKKEEKKLRRRYKEHDRPVHVANHTFLLTIINIPTACEICTSFFMWPIERGLVCQNCKLTCHKKCSSRVVSECGAVVVGGSKGGPTSPHHIFGVPLHQLATGDGKVPLVVDRLITTIEMYGLYSEGIYRKSGVSSKVRELKSRMEEGNLENVEFEHYQVHVLASVLKSFLREMPEPLLTFDCYDDLLRAANLTEDRVSTLFAILKKLPKPNFDLMERLIFHLARVALHEDVNRMSASSLAIVFAPCVLRTNKLVPAQDSLHDIARQTQCVETIIAEQLGRVRATLADIDTLDTACHTATHRLSSLRSSKIFSAEELLPAKAAADEEEELLMGHIEEIQKEKALLTCGLPSLTRSPSDDDLLSTDDGSLDDVDVQPQPLSRHRMGNKPRCKRQQDNNSAYSPDCEEDPIMV